MKIMDDFSLVNEETVATVGVFDGVHSGHRYLLDCLKKEAKRADLKSAVVTFPIHPRKALYPLNKTLLLTTFEEKIYKLSSLNIDYCYVIPFTIKFSTISAKDFMEQILSKQLHVKKLLVGYDHRFGNGGNTTYQQYVEYGKMCGISVLQAKKLPKKKYNNSSTFIRRLILEGDTEKASEILSYDYFLEGTVIHGSHMGKAIGFPTANICPNHLEKIIPKSGVYSAKVRVKMKKYFGMVYIGKRPTITSNREKRIEVNLFAFDEDIYGEKIQIIFGSFIRPDSSFKDLTKLKMQLEKDKQIIQENFNMYKNKY